MTHKDLNIGESLNLKLNVPCGISTHRIEFQRYDYIKGSFDVGLNGKTGRMHMVNYRAKVTLKSYLYYICK